MIIEQAIKGELSLNDNLVALINNRLDYVKAPQDIAKPYVVFFKVSDPREHSHQGASALARARFQFSIFAETYKECKQIAKQIQISLQGYSGIMGGEEGVFVGGCFYVDETDNYEPQTQLYHVSVDYVIWHKE